MSREGLFINRDQYRLYLQALGLPEAEIETKLSEAEEVGHGTLWVKTSWLVWPTLQTEKDYSTSPAISKKSYSPKD